MWLILLALRCNRAAEYAINLAGSAFDIVPIELPIFVLQLLPQPVYMHFKAATSRSRHCTPKIRLRIICRAVARGV